MAFRGVRASAAHCLSNGNIAVKAKRTTSLPQNLEFHAGSSNMRMLNLSSQPDKLPNMGMYFISEENPKFAVLTHFFIYKNTDAFSYLSLYTTKYTYPSIFKCNCKFNRAVCSAMLGRSRIIFSPSLPLSQNIHEAEWRSSFSYKSSKTSSPTTAWSLDCYCSKS